LAAALEEVLDRLERGVRDRDDEVTPYEQVELACIEPADGTVEDGEVKDDEEVVRVLVDLRPLIARENILEIKRVEVEVLGEPGGLELTRALDVDPAKAAAVDYLDARAALGLIDRRGE